jgi:energy-coupling factor transport system permease protein
MDYFNRNTQSPLGRLDVRLKMAIGLAVSILVIIVDTFAALSACALIGMCCFALCRPNRKQITLVSVTTLLVVWGLMFSQGLFYAQEPRHAILVLLKPNPVFKAGLKIYAQGLYHGAIQSFRIIAASLTGFAICFSTEPDQFLRGLLSVKVPFSLSFMAVSAIRFIPVVAQELATVRNAMRLKGYRPLKRGLADTIHSEIAALRPVLAGTIRRSQEIALSIQTRGFSIDGKRSSWTESALSARGVCALWGILAIVLAVALCKSVFWLYLWEVCYAPALRPLYAFVRAWL